MNSHFLSEKKEILFRQSPNFSTIKYLLQVKCKKITWEKLGYQDSNFFPVSSHTYPIFKIVIKKKKSNNAIVKIFYRSKKIFCYNWSRKLLYRNTSFAPIKSSLRSVSSILQSCKSFLLALSWHVDNSLFLFIELRGPAVESERHDGPVRATATGKGTVHRALPDPSQQGEAELGD